MSEENQLSIDDTMAAVFDKMEAADTNEENGTPGPPEAAANPSGETEGQAETRAQTRGPDGKFIKAEPAAEGATAEQVSEAKAPEKTDQGTETERKPASQPLAPPERWSAEDKASFAALPREAQELVLKRESDVQKYLTQKSQEISEQSRRFEGVERLIAPRRQQWALAGYGSDDQFLGHLFAVSDFADRDPPGFIKWFAQQRGIDLAQATKPAESYEDPALTPLQQRLQKLEQSEVDRKRAEDERIANEQRARVEAFKSETDEKGNLKRPYFEDVRVHMAALMRQGLAKDMSDAYEQAVYANPTVRAKVLADQRAAEEAKRMEEAKAAAEKARKAAGTNLQSKGSLPGSRVTRTIDETMSEAYDRAVGAA